MTSPAATARKSICARLAAVVDRRAQDAQAALGGLTETRQLLFAALLIADDLKETRAGMGLPDPAPPPPDPAVAEALERLAAEARKPGRQA